MNGCSFCNSLLTGFLVICSLMLGDHVYADANNHDDLIAAQKIKVSQASGVQISLSMVNAQNDERIAVQYILKNVSSTRLYIMVAPTCQASTDVGIYMGLIEQTGVSVCPTDCRETYTAYLKRCANDAGKEIDNYTYLESGDYLAASIIYGGGFYSATKSKTISFALSVLTRKAPENIDPLNLLDANKAIPPAVITTVQFPLIPFVQAK